MPIYEYKCPDCGHQFETMQKFSDDPITVCPKCEEENVRKMISAPAFHLKGGGWYKDHYGLKSGGGDTSSSGSSSSSSSSASSSGSSDSSSGGSDGAASSGSSDSSSSSSDSSSGSSDSGSGSSTASDS